jgi:AraC family transcriptional regulator
MRTLNQARFFSIRRRMQTVVEFMDACEGPAPSLNTLADIACMSRCHFAATYQTLTGEAPLQTLRRLRLAKARDALRTRALNVTDAAFAAGYSSIAAFSRAFHARFGVWPSSIQAEDSLGGAQPLRIETVHLPTLHAKGVSFSGALSESGAPFDELLAHATRKKAPMRRGDVMGIHEHLDMTQARVSLEAVITNPRALDALQLPRKLFPGGPFARFELCAYLPPSVWRDALETHGLQWNAEPIRVRYLRDPMLTPPSERRFEVLVPLRAAPHSAHA